MANDVSFQVMVDAIGEAVSRRVREILTEKMRPGPVAIGVQVVPELEHMALVGGEPTLNSIRIQLTQEANPEKMRGRAFDCVFVDESAELADVIKALAGPVVKPITGENA